MTTYAITFRPTDTGLVLDGASFVVFQKLSDGTAPTNAAPVTITEVGYGAYKFEYTAVEDVVFVIDGGDSLPDTDRYVRGVLSPMDGRLDAAVSSRASQASMDTLHQLEYGRWKIHKDGPDANHLIIYSDDGVTELARFALKDIDGNPAYRNVFERVPV